MATISQFITNIATSVNMLFHPYYICTDDFSSFLKTKKNIFVAFSKHANHMAITSTSFILLFKCVVLKFLFSMNRKDYRIVFP
jgi:galactose mutarotase-like enzyme